MRKLVGVLIAATFTAAALAQYDVRGGFNGWAQSPMNDDLDGTYSLTVGGLNPGDYHEFKIDTGNWASSWPGTNAKSMVSAAGQMTFHFRPGAVADGWFPGADRVGYDDHGMFGWEITGAMNGWSDGVDTAARQMTNMGGGLYSVDYNIAAAGSYDFKFRKSGDWAVSIGDNFGNAAANNNVTTGVVNQLVRFELDLPNGRWRTTFVPEPTTLVLLAGGALLARRFARRR